MNDFHDFYREKILPYEGGYVNDPDDSGGMTNLGITWRTLAYYEERDPNTVTEAEMRALTKEYAEEIYRSLFWLRFRGDQLCRGLAILVVDHACGNPQKAVQMLQRMTLNPKVDSRMGPQTVRLANEFCAQHGVQRAMEMYAELRYEEYRRIGREYPNKQKFVNGWLRRAKETREWMLGRLGDAA